MALALRCFLSTTALAVFPAVAFSLTVTPTNDASGLANTLFLNTGGVFLQGSSVSGATGQFGTYQNASGTYGLPVTGIMLSSGNVSDYASGPNSTSDQTTSYGNVASDAQNALLEPITGQSSHFDVADLSIDFATDAATSSVTFFATFGSEEWPEFVSSSFNDVFGLYVNGINVAAAGLRPINIDHPDMRDIPGTELDGILVPNGNPVLRFDVPVNAGGTNNFRIILADASDSSLDTTIYLSSFFSEGGGGSATPGQSEFNPILPSNLPDPVTGAFVINLPDNVEDRETIWIDPPIAVGYTYALDGTGAFASITAPSLATVADIDGYTVTIDGTEYTLGAGATFDLLDAGLSGVQGFTLTGIDPDLMLNPANGEAFPLGVGFLGLGNGSSIIQTPITQDSVPAVPLPAAGWMLMAGFGSLAMLRRRRRLHV